MNAEEFNRCLRLLRESEGAFRRIYEYYLPRIKRHLLSRFGRKVDFDDVAHEVFTRLLRSTPQYVEKPNAYIYRMCDNLALDEIRRRQRFAPLDERFAMADDGAEGLPDGGGFFAIIDKLDGGDREIIELTEWEGYSLKEAAELLGIGYGAARQRRARAFKKLKAILKR